MRWVQRLRERRAIRAGRYECPRCGGWLETGMPYPHAAQIHIREFCSEIDPAEVGREIALVMRRYEKTMGR